MKHIVVLSTFFAPFRSGAEPMVEEIVSQNSEYSYTIIAARLRRNLPTSEQWNDHTRLIRIGFGIGFDKWLYPFLSIPHLVRLKPDLIHANLESFAGMALVLFSYLRPNIPRILTNQNTYTTYRGWFNSLPLIALMHRRATKVTVLSQSLYNRAVQFKRSDAVIIPNGVHVYDVPEFLPEFGRIVFVGRLEEIKGVDILLSAFVHLPTHAHLRIIGTGSQEQQLRIQASRLGIVDRVTFVGQCTHDEVLQEMAQAEIFCGVSRSEAFGNVFIEALAVGCAVVATNVDGIPDIIEHEYNGLLVAPNSVEQTAQSLERLLNDAQLRETLSKNGKIFVQKFDWTHVISQYSILYSSLLRK
jgi:glycosyltransferase involved in cell wall biosynthesis